MNQKNLEYLRDQIKYTGFGEGMESVLKENILKGNAEFKLNHEVKYGNDTVNSTLNFKKSEQSGMYFFNSYVADLKKDQSKEGLQQTFYVNNDSSNTITAKESYNLMEGRAVNKDLKTKEGESYNSWLKLDFKEIENNGNFKLNHYHQNYGYDLEASLGKHPIKELENSKYKEDLLNSLKKGNVQSVTFVSGGVEKKQFVEANPHFKTINVYDADMQRISNRERKDESLGEAEGKTTGKNNKQQQNDNAEAPEAGERKTQKKKSKSNSI